MTTGVRGAYVKDMTFPEGFARGHARAIRERVDVPVIVTGRLRTPAVAEQVLAAGDADYIGLGRALLADPEWPAKARDGREGQIRPCIACLQDCRRAIGLIGCTVHARTGRELEWGPAGLPSATRVVIAGGGPAGLEAARVAAESGSAVVLFERAGELGGQVRIAAAAPTRAELLEFVRWEERELRRLGVEVRMEVAATVAAVLAERPELFICATGATPLAPELETDGQTTVTDVWELLGGCVSELGERAVVIDDGSGFWHAVGAAEWLAERGVAVELVTRARGVAQTLPHESAAGLLRRLRAHGVGFHTLVEATSIQRGQVVLADALTGETIGSIAADLVVVRTALAPDPELAHQLEGHVRAIAVIGDCAAPRRLTHAVLDANRAVRRFTAGGPAGNATALV